MNAQPEYLTCTVFITDQDLSMTLLKWSELIEDISWLVVQYKYDVLYSNTGSFNPKSLFAHCWVFNISNDSDYIELFKKRLAKLDCPKDTIAVSISTAAYIK